MAIRKRHSIQRKIEEISRSQFKELITSNGWQPYDINPDFGLDLRIEIVQEGVSTGLSFNVQLKGTSDSSKHQLKDDQFSYSFDTDDLKYINQQLNPSYIVLWDINLRKGWYVSINSVVKQLNHASPGWSDQGHVKIHIPLNQELNPENLDNIRIEITETVLPYYLEREPLKVNVTFSFPKDEFGQRKYQELIDSFETGRPFEIEKKLVQNIDVSDWWVRLMGEKSLETMEFKIGPSIPIPMPPVRIDFVSPGKSPISIDYVELKDIQHGTKQAVLSNEHQQIPYKFNFTVNWSQRNGHFNVSINSAGVDAVEAKKAVDLACLLTIGGEIRIRRLDTNEVETLIYQPDPSVKPKDNEIEFIDCLAMIQAYTGILILIPELASFTNIDLENAKKVLSLVTTGFYHKHTEKVTFSLIKSDILTIATSYISGENYKLVTTGDDISAELLSTRIPLGKVKQVISGKCNIPAEAFDEWIKTAEEKDIFQIELQDVEITEESEKWKKPFD